MFIDPKLVKPKIKGESDKYSWNLYRWLYKYRKYADYKVYYIADEEFDRNNLKLSKIIIGKKHSDREITGNLLSNIINKGSCSEDSYCFLKSIGWNTDKAIDITELFKKEYIRIGRCFIFGHTDIWLRGDKDKFTIINKHSRRCNWCGKYENRYIETEKTIKRKEVWR